VLVVSLRFFGAVRVCCLYLVCFAMTEPLLPCTPSTPSTPDRPTVLEEWLKTENVRLPAWASAKEVEAWVQLLTVRDVESAGSVKVYGGYEESAYRYVFPYKEQYKKKKDKLQNLITVLPTAQRENDEPLLHNDEAGLIAYTKSQDMEPDLAKKQPKVVDPFVWARDDGKTFAVVQTWPVEINKAFEQAFRKVENPESDPVHFEPRALSEFKTSMRKLFQLPKSGDDELKVMSVVRERKHETPIYIGTGEYLMAMLRISKTVREELMIESLVGRKCLQCRWECEGRTGTHQWQLDLSTEFCLYLKQGWDTMACIKPKTQFDYDSHTIGREDSIINQGGACKNLPYMMDVEWFAPEAFSWTLTSAVLVWSCAIVMVLLRWYGAASGWGWVNTPVVLVIAASVAIAFALWADFSAMKWCIVPWMQKMKKFDVLGRQCSFGTFLAIHLLGTFFQVLTIQTNAWFMLTAVQENNDVVEYWQYLWENSAFGFLPNSTWKTWFTPKWLAIFLWLLSTVQLTLPLLTSVPLPGTKKRCPFPTRSARDAELLQSGEVLIKHGTRFKPELYHNHFHTIWTKVTVYVLEVWGFHSVVCTYREGVANLALASGLRYTGSMSLSYPRQQLTDIMQFHEGYTVKKKDGNLEPLPMGWELRALNEFQKLARYQRKRVFFIMFCKLALQMNLQITFFMIFHIKQKEKESDEYMNENTVMGMISITSLLLNFFSEFTDVVMITIVFCRVRSQVRKTILQTGDSSKVFAQEDFVVEKEEGDESVQSLIHSGKDFKEEYYMAMRLWWSTILVAIFSTWLIGYALLKAVCAVKCSSGYWEFSSGCLPPMG